MSTEQSPNSPSKSPDIEEQLQTLKEEEDLAIDNTIENLNNLRDKLITYKESLDE